MRGKWILSILCFNILIAQLPVIKIISPLEADPIIAYNEVDIFGELKHADKLFVNNYNVELQDGLFRLKFKFSEDGYREFVFKAENVHGKVEKKLKVLALKTYPDIESSPYKTQIELLSTLGILDSYYGTDFYKPGQYVRKAELSRILLRLNNIATTAQYRITYHFQDLLKTHWAYHYIQLALNNNLVYPTNATEFSPDRIMSREEVLQILRNVYKLNRETSKAFFQDLLTDKSEHRWISYLAKQGYLPPNWINNENFYPDKPVTRGELAYILSRISFLNQKIQDEYNVVQVYEKKPPLAGYEDQIFMLSFKRLTSDVFLIECNPDREKKVLFVEFQLKSKNDNATVLLVDDGDGLDLIKGDNVYSGIINFSHHQEGEYKYLYKLFDEYNLIYKVGDGTLIFNNDELSIR